MHIEDQKNVIRQQKIEVNTHKDLAMTFLEELQKEALSRNQDDVFITNLSNQLRAKLDSVSKMMATIDDENQAVATGDQKLNTIPGNATILELEKVNAELIQKSEKIMKLEEELCSIHSQNSKNEKELNDVKVECENKEKELNSDLKSKINEIVKLKESLSLLECQNSKNEKEIHDMKTEEDMFNQMCLAKDAIIKQYASERDAALETLSNGVQVNVEVEELRKSNDRLIETSKQNERLHEESKIELNKQVQVLQNLNTELHKQIEESKNHSISAIKEHDTASVNKQKLQNLCALKEMIKHNNDASEQIKMLSKMKEMVEERDKEIQDLKDHNKFIEQELDEKKRTITEKIKEMSTMQDKITVLNNNIKVNMTKSQSELTSLTNTIKEHVNRIKAYKEQINQLTYLNKLLNEEQKTSDQPETKLNKPQQKERMSIQKPMLPTRGISPHSHSEPTRQPQQSTRVAAQQPMWSTQGTNTHSQFEPFIRQELQNTATPHKEFCFAEIRTKGSCTNRYCKFSHQIPSQLTSSKDEAVMYIKQRNLCVNEFRQKDSCHKKQGCRFSH